MWRTGELPVPKITFSRDVTLVDKEVPAGTYALLTIPSPSTWTIILNKDANLIGERDYKPALDVARVVVPSKPAPHRERFAFLFSEFTDDQTLLDLEWEKLRVSIPIKVHTAEQMAAEIGALDGFWRRYADMARYMLDKGNYDAGLGYVDRSLVLKKDDYNLAIRSALLEAKGRQGEARGMADRAPRPIRTTREELRAEPTMMRASTEGGEPFSSIGERGGAGLEPASARSVSVGERRIRIRGSGRSGGGAGARAPRAGRSVRSSRGARRTSRPAISDRCGRTRRSGGGRSRSR